MGDGAGGGSRATQQRAPTFAVLPCKMVGLPSALPHFNH